MTFYEFMEEELNYKCITTFWDDFAIADRFGIEAIKDTFQRAFNEWKSNYKFLTELVLVLNHRCWFHYNNQRMELMEVYRDIFYQAKDYAESNLKGKEFEYYFNVTD
ncbi:hypothetical protein [Parabacteroides merdae]|uniref:hypothetical protein n=1 Tax=Parabacteroides merdae TaxID=46503 RepID=UPI0034A19D0C